MGFIFVIRRTEFTARDEFHLTEYIATRIPDKAAGGRTGNKIYIELCSDVSMSGLLDSGAYCSSIALQGCIPMGYKSSVEFMARKIQEKLRAL